MLDAGTRGDGRGTLLVLHDTTEFSYPRENIGLRHRSRNPGRSPRPLCGISMHSSLVVTPAGLPLGLSAVKLWTRKAFKGANELKRRVNPTRFLIGQKESVRWVENLVETTALLGAPGRCVHIGDREADIYEQFCAANDVGAHFVIRSAYARLAENGMTKTDVLMQDAPLTVALTAGVPLEIVQRVTGHRTTDIVLKHYFQPGKEDFRRTLAGKLPALLGDHTQRTADEFNLADLRAKLTAMEDSTWRHIRDELLGRLPAEKNVTPLPALSKSSFAA